MKVKTDKYEYEIIKDERDSFNKEDFLNRYTDYFEPYDYIVGDYAYGKLRLKGFYNDNNKNATAINKISYMDEYVRDYCAYNCKYFLLSHLLLKPENSLKLFILFFRLE